MIDGLDVACWAPVNKWHKYMKTSELNETATALGKLEDFHTKERM